MIDAELAEDLAEERARGEAQRLAWFFGVEADEEDAVSEPRQGMPPALPSAKPAP